MSRHLSCRPHRFTATISLIAVAVTLSASAVLAGGGKKVDGTGGGAGNPRIAPPHSHAYGASYGEWAARWWQWALSIPADNHPFLGGDVLQGQTGHVVFLVGIFGGAEISLTIPPGTPLFFPIVNSECSTIEPDPFHGDNEAELRACAKGFIDHTSGLAAEIDGVAVENLSAYRHQSPVFTIAPLPENNIFGLPAGSTGLSVDDGYYLMVHPLSVGEHTIHFTGTFDDFGATIETTYHISVDPHAAPGSFSTELAGIRTKPVDDPAHPSTTWGRMKAIYR